MRYMDASGSVYELTVSRSEIVSTVPTIAAIGGSKVNAKTIVLVVGDIRKTFRRTADSATYLISEVKHRNGGRLTLKRTGTAITRIESNNGNYLTVVRNKSGRIVAAEDNRGRSVEYRYVGRNKQLNGILDRSGGQWIVDYDQSGRLSELRNQVAGRTVLAAGYHEDGKVKLTRFQNRRTSFRFEPNATVVRRDRNRTAKFWHLPNGLTNKIRASDGSETEIQFDKKLRPTALFYDGDSVSRLRYKNGQLAKLQVMIGSAAGRYEYRYDTAGRLRGVKQDGKQVAKFNYSSAGLLTDAMSNEVSRRYGYGRRGYVTDFWLDGNVTRLDYDDFGRVVGARNGATDVDLIYSAFSNEVSEVQISRGDFVYVENFEYSRNGLRRGGRYLVENADDSIQVDAEIQYDDLGNMIQMSVSSAGEILQTDQYIVDDSNQLREVQSSSGSEMRFEYDRNGLPTTVTMDKRNASFTYDSKGRLTEAELDGKKTLVQQYSGIDSDIVSRADDRTMRSPVRDPVVSSIYASVEKIFYTRTKGSPYGVIQFDPASEGFRLLAKPYFEPDRVLRNSLEETVNKTV